MPPRPKPCPFWAPPPIMSFSSPPIIPPWAPPIMSFSSPAGPFWSLPVLAAPYHWRDQARISRTSVAWAFTTPRAKATMGWC